MIPAAAAVEVEYWHGPPEGTSQPLAFGVGDLRLNPAAAAAAAADSGNSNIFDLVLRSLDTNLAAQDPFHAALGLVLLSKLGFRWDQY